jgi:uncharacterized protein (TIGR00369 family)
MTPTPEHALLRDSLRMSVDVPIAARVSTWDEAGEYPRSRHACAAEIGLLGPGRTSDREPGRATIRHMTASTELDADFVDHVTQLFERQIRFNALLGLKLTRVAAVGVAARLEMREDLVGHALHQRLHGGVIGSVLDSLGGLAVMAAMGSRHRDEPVLTRMNRFAKLGTIDLRVDYLRPAKGPHFTATGCVLRLGSRVASTRMEFRDAHDELLATGSAAFIVS